MKKRETTSGSESGGSAAIAAARRLAISASPIAVPVSERAASRACCAATERSHFSWPCSSIIDALQRSDTLVRSSGAPVWSSRLEKATLCGPARLVANRPPTRATPSAGTARNHAKRRRSSAGPAATRASEATGGALSGRSSA